MRTRDAFLVALALFGLMLDCAPIAAAEQTFTIAGLKVTEWSNGRASGPQPVIVFSHGFHGCDSQSRFLMEALAEAGYEVFAPNHHDATCDGGESSWREHSNIPFAKPRIWNDNSYRDRADDIRKLIAALQSDDRYRSRLDWTRLGLMGHSLGGYTVLGLAGAWPGWKLHNVKAVLALSPYSQPFIVQNTLHGLSAPVMYQGGTMDFGVTPSIRKNSGAYEQSPPPKYYIEFKGASHFAWTNLGVVAHDEIAAYCVAFMDVYLKGELPSPILSKAMKDVAVLRSNLK